MRGQTLTRGILVFIIHILTIGGAVIPTAIYALTRASSDDLSLPGIPISDTPFSILVNDSLPATTISVNSSASSTRPYIVQVSMPNSGLLNKSKASELAWEYIDDNHKEILHLSGEVTLHRLFPEWTIRLSGSNSTHELVVVLGLNAQTGGLVQYHHHWNPLHPASGGNSSLVESSSMNSTEIGNILYEFMTERALYLSSSMRLMRVTAFPGSSNPVFYNVEVVEPYGQVLGDKTIQGLFARVSVNQKEVTDLTYRLLSIPGQVVSANELIDPELVWQQFMDGGTSEVQYLQSFNYQRAFLRLHLTNGTPAPSFSLRLVWAVEVSNPEESPEPLEIYFDIFSGERISHDPVYLHINLPIGDYIILSMLIPFFAILPAIICYYCVKNRELRIDYAMESDFDLEDITFQYIGNQDKG